MSKEYVARRKAEIIFSNRKNNDSTAKYAESSKQEPSKVEYENKSFPIEPKYNRGECCAVNGCFETEELHEHHIIPVVYSGENRKKKKKPLEFDSSKPLGDCTLKELFAYMMEIGCVSDSGTITVCGYHHRILHGVMSYEKIKASSLIKEALRKKKEAGFKLGRPSSLTPAIISLVKIERSNGTSIRKLAKKFSIGTGTIYRIISGYYDGKTNE